MLRNMMVRVDINPGDTGLFYGTSRDMKGLLIAKPTEKEVEDSIAETLADMYFADGAETVNVLRVNDRTWVVKRKQ